MNGSGAPGGPSIVGTVGTDHHPFDRLIAWLDRFAADHPSVSTFVQSGTSAPPRTCDGSAYLAFDELGARLAGSVAVVSHGGPATIMDARAAGRLPIVLPRQSGLGEHVDDHQVRFSTWMDSRGQVVLAHDEDHLTELLEGALADPSRYVLDPAAGAGEAAIRRFGDLVDGMLA